MLKDEVGGLMNWNWLISTLVNVLLEGENAHLPKLNVAQQASLQGQGLFIIVLVSPELPMKPMNPRLFLTSDVEQEFSPCLLPRL